jgi:hypothetical protein
MLDSCVLRGREGKNSGASGTLPELNSTYDFHYLSVSVSSGSPRLIHFDQLRLTVTTPTSQRNKEGYAINDSSHIETDIDAAEGQKVVVGKSSVNGQNALILVVTAKVIEPN